MITTSLLDKECDLEPVKQELANGESLTLFNHLKAHSFVQLDFKRHP